MPFAVAVKLRKDIIPYFYKTVAVAAYLAVRLAAAILGAPVVINLRAGAAGASAVLPEIIALSGFRVTVKPCNLLRRHANLIDPYLISLLVLTVDRWIKPLWV